MGTEIHDGDRIHIKRHAGRDDGRGAGEHRLRWQITATSPDTGGERLWITLDFDEMIELADALGDSGYWYGPVNRAS